MALVAEHHILEHIQKIIRHEGRGRREAHRFANAVQNDPILSYRLRELRLRSQERPPAARRHFRTQHHHPRRPRGAEAGEEPELDRSPPRDEPHEPYEEDNAPSPGREASPPTKRRRSERRSERRRAEDE